LGYAVIGASHVISPACRRQVRVSGATPLLIDKTETVVL
jgi:hypothetical protein